MTTGAVRPPLDADVARALTHQPVVDLSEVTAQSMLKLRGLANKPDIQSLTLNGYYTREVLNIARGTGSIPVVVYRPAHTVRPLPLLVHLHGGGLVSGSADSDVLHINEMAREIGAAVMTIDYRLAPEHPFPAAIDDTTAVLEWLRVTPPAFVDNTRVVLTGISAGGGLAACTALHLRDHNGFELAGVLLMCPMLDSANSTASVTQTPLCDRSWNKQANQAAWAAYLGSSQSNQYASASLAQCLANLPPVFIDVGSAEIFRDECVTFAGRIWQAGGNAELHVWPGAVHAFDYMAPWAPMSGQARTTRLNWIRRLLESK